MAGFKIIINWMAGTCTGF